MKIFVRVKPNSKSPKLEKIDSTHFNIWVKEPPREGLANEAAALAIAAYFDRPKSSVKLASGRTSRNKVFEI